jgi:hypothetical protein
MLPYLLYAALLLALFFGFYKILLEKETFFHLNRWFLVGGLFLCFLVPTIVIPEHWSIREVSQSPLEDQAFLFPEKAIPSPIEVNPISSAITNADPEIPAIPEVPVLAESPTEETQLIQTSYSSWQNLAWKQLLWHGYLIGIGIFFINLLIQLTVLIRQMVKSPKLKDGKFYIVEMADDKAPYSFLNHIFINPSKYDWDTYNQILDHEKIHISQAHSIDMILAELLVVIQWFNPFAWQYRKAIENNLEYLTDSEMLNQGADRQPYQMNLLKVSVPHYPIGFAMNYNQSFLKKRIKMMNAKKSSVRTSWKYLAIFPIIGLCLICFNAVKVAANQQNQAQEFDYFEGEWEEPWEEIAEAAEEMGLQIQHELEKAFLDQESRFQYSFSGKTPLEMKGIWRADIAGKRICVQFDNSDERRNSHWISTECFDRSEFSALPKNKGEFTLTRPAGVVNFTGEFEGDEGYGKYEFVGNQDFVQMLNQKGIRGEASEETLFHFFMTNIDEDYINDIEKMGFSSIDMGDLKKMAIHDVSRDYIREMAALGYDDLSPEDLVKGRIHDVDPEYIREIRESGFPNLSFEELVKFSIHDVDESLVKSLAKAGFTKLSAEEIVKASIHDVDAEYLEELKGVGFDLEDLDEVIKFSIHGVDANLVGSLNSAGFSNLDAEAITKAAIHGVDEDYISELAEAGYEFDDIEDVVKFSIHGVDADFVEELNEAGYKNISAEQIRKAAIHGVDEDYIEELKETGMDLPSIEDVIEFSIHGVRPNYIAALQDLGYDNLSADEIRKAAIQGVRVSYIESLNEVGFKDIPMEEVIKCKIHGLSAKFITKARAEGYKDRSLNEYRKMKIQGILR